ncbi:MAG: 30S ribosomal protein S21 [Candidatus Poribacteria bacterium]
MVEVRVNQDESLNRALNRFKRQCEKAGIQKEIKKHLRYQKPSERRHRKRRDLKRKKR